MIETEQEDRDWFAEHDTDGGEEHPVDVQVRQRLERQPRHAEAVDRIRDLHGAVSAALGDRRDLWLELEELLNERTVAREAAYYNVGVDAGRAGRVVGEVLGAASHADDPRELLRVLGGVGSALVELAHRALAAVEGTSIPGRTAAELERELDGAIAEGLRWAGDMGLKPAEVSQLGAVLRELSHTAIRAGYERGLAEGRRTRS